MAWVCVLGMHRSGTSCLTGILQKLGVELGDVHTENLHNRRGNRENSRVVSLNDALLRANQAAWNAPRVITRWDTSHASERDAIVQSLQQRGAEHRGFKDPRTLFTLPFWLERLPAPRFIGTYRHPLHVARSLQARDGSSLDEGCRLWVLYNARLLELARLHCFPLVHFDQDADDYLDDVLGKLAGLNPDAADRAAAREFFEPALRHQRGQPDGNESLPAGVQTLYRHLQQYDKAYNAAHG